MSQVVIISPDLMFSSQLLGAARTLGLKLAIVANPADAPQQIKADSRLVLVDLTVAASQLPAIVAAARQNVPAAKIVAFGPHVDEALLNSARQAGCDLVLSRGQFHKQYAELLKHVAVV